MAEAEVLLAGTTAATGSEKTASPDVTNLATLLAGATESVDVAAEAGTTGVEFEKAAMSLNRLNTACYLDAMTKVAGFEEKALAEGYSQAQIDEVLAKTAAKKTLDHLPLLVAMADLPAPDKNVLPTKPKKPSMDKKLNRLPLTKSWGY